MSGSFTAAIPFILIGLVLLVLVVWLILHLNKSTTVVGDETARKDVLDEGAAPAARNQALIDAAPAAVQDTPAPLPKETAPTPAIAPTPPLAQEPAPVPALPAVEDTPASLANPARADDLRQIKGVGPKLVTMLDELGITSFAQIAAWTESDIAEIDPKLGRFSGRVERDQWVEQAKLLISGDTSAFSEKFGNNG